eukprot:scaffold82589_cov66-Phaeocystis_antarctica.AAC.1
MCISARARRAVVCPAEACLERAGDGVRHEGALLYGHVIIGARSFHVSIHTKISSAPMHRIKKRPSSSKVAMRDWPHLGRGGGRARAKG